jgi:glyoxylase-like metal-dependent hydrolase (beta-lactamase superfamily II)
MSMTRRDFLVSGVALSAACMTGLLAGAAMATAGTTTPGASVTRVDLGAVRVTMLSDGYFARPLDANFVRNAALADVQAALASAGLPTDRVEVPFNPLVVDVGGRRVLFDAGNGEFGAATAGRLLANMEKAGITPDSIDAVVISHFHGDHINGLRDMAGRLVFRNAKVYVPEPEWNWWMDDARMAAAPEAMRGVFSAARRVFGPIADAVVKFTPGSEVLPGVRSLPAYGHTPGHTVFTVEGGTRRLMFWADTTNVAALFVRNPDWAVMFDMDPEAARLTRRRLSEMVVNENLLLAGYHLPGAGIGTLVRRGEGYDFTPLP